MKQIKRIAVFLVLLMVVSCIQQVKYTKYVAKKGETISSIAKKFNVSERELARLNPGLGKVVKVDTEISIPKKSIIINTKNDASTTSSSENEKNEIEDVEKLKENFIIHKVKKGDTFYSLTRYYDVTKAELLALNPILNEGLKYGSVIKIKERIITNTTSKNKIYSDNISYHNEVQMALLLPFSAKSLQEVDGKEIFKKGNLSSIVTDFYLGAELAIDSLNNLGVKIKLHVIDTEKRSTKINEILSNNQLENMDAVIGPVYWQEVLKVAETISVPVVFPVFSKNQYKFSSSTIVKTAPDKSLYLEKLISFLTDNHTDQNIIIVGDDTETTKASIEQMAATLLEHQSITTVHQIYPEKGYIKKQKFLDLMNSNVDNWIVVATGDNVMVSNTVNSLISLPLELEPRVKTFAIEKTESFSMIDNNKLAKINFTYVSDSYLDVNSKESKLFDKKYYKRNSALPSEDAIRGFDVVYDVGMRLASGDKLQNTFDQGVSYRLVSKFDFRKKMFGISENKGLFLLKYNPDLSLTKLE